MFEIKEPTQKKIASFPRVFYFDFSKAKDDDLNLDKKIVSECFDTLLNYAKSFVVCDDSKQAQEAIFLTVKSVRNIFSKLMGKEQHQGNFICLFCSAVSEEEFDCKCVSQNLHENFEIKSDFLLISYLNNKSDLDDLVLEVSANISSQAIKYVELNRCKDLTRQYVPESNMQLQDLLDYFMADEKLKLEDNYLCPSCKNNVVAYKNMMINKFPPVLIINLKRFRLESNLLRPRVSRRNEIGFGNYSGEKNEGLVSFPINSLDLTKYTKDNSQVEYELYAVCNHQGKISSGHYTAACKHPASSKWVFYDDKNVKSCSEIGLDSHSAYVLFYRIKK